MAELRLEKLSKAFTGSNGVRAVQNLSLTVADGECVALLGPSGAGKSTVLRLIAGLLTPDSGEVYMNGKSILELSPAEREISMAFQFPALLPQLTVRENLCLGPRLRRAGDIQDRLLQLSELLALTSLLARKPETLSGGEQQRVALGRALITSPRLLLLDEPLANLDPVSRGQLRDSIGLVQRQLGVTTLYVTHDQVEAAALADRIAILRGGELEQCGTPHEIYRNPAIQFVAEFFGPDPMNVFTGTVGGNEQEPFVEIAEGVRVKLARMPSDPQTGEITVSFRPSDVQLLITPANGWRVKKRRDLGWSTMLLLAKDRLEIATRQPSDCVWKVGDTVEVKIEPSLVYLFRKNSGARVF